MRLLDAVAGACQAIAFVPRKSTISWGTRLRRVRVVGFPHDVSCDYVKLAKLIRVVALLHERHDRALLDSR